MTKVGVFVRTGRDCQAVARAAEQMRDAGVTWTVIKALWQPTGTGFSTEEAAYWSYTMEQIGGISTDVWGYPSPGGEEEFAKTLVDVAHAAHAKRLILDPEVLFKNRPGAARRLVVATLDAMDESMDLGISSYGIPRFHGTFPWDEFGGVGFGVPQLYTVGVHEALKGVDEWKSLGWTKNIPALAGFGPRSNGHFLGQLHAFSDFDRILIWSWRQLDSQERRDLSVFTRNRG